MTRWPKDEKGKPGKAQDKQTKRKRRVAEIAADWGSADGDLLRCVIANITRDDGAIRFGYSRDGGAYSVGVYGDGEPYTEYLGGKEDIDEWLRGLALDFE